MVRQKSIWSLILDWVKDKRFDLIEQEIRTLKSACQDKILKVIIETCLLTEEEQNKKCCEVVYKSMEQTILRLLPDFPPQELPLKM